MKQNAIPNAAAKEGKKTHNTQSAKIPQPQDIIEGNKN